MPQTPFRLFNGWLAVEPPASPQFFDLSATSANHMAPKRRHRRNHNEPGHAHEITFSCHKGFKFLKAERTCGWLAESIEKARAEWQFDLWAYVFMAEHVHLIVRPRDADYDIAEIRTAIKAPVGRKAIAYLESDAPDWLPKITRKRGKKMERLFWQSGGGYDRNVVMPETLMKMIDYVHLNPVRRALVERPEDWEWSSAAWYAGAGEGPVVPDSIPPEWLVELP